MAGADQRLRIQPADPIQGSKWRVTNVLSVALFLLRPNSGANLLLARKEMNSHHSLFSQFSPPPGLRPQAEMNPYELCWCKSGLKWKWCHKDREKKEPIPLGRRIHNLRNANIKSYCSHPLASPETCSNLIIQAHTIQRQGGLSLIAENGHVMSVKGGASHIHANQGLLIPQLMGVRIASTFDGFCNTHDTNLFAPIEDGSLDLCAQAAFLMSFRAVAYELYQKKNSIAGLEVQRMSDLGQPFEDQAAIQSHLYNFLQGSLRGLENVQAWKAKYDRLHLENDVSNFKFYSVKFDQLLPAAGAGAFHPEVSFAGQQLQILSSGRNEFDHITITLTPFQGTSALTFGWIGSNAGPSQEFVSSFAALPDNDKANAAMHLLFEHIENTYIRPSWWKSLPSNQNSAALARFAGGTGLRGYMRSQEDLTDLTPAFIEARVVDVQQNVAL